MMDKQVLFDGLFWFFMVFGVVLLLWKVFGDSPMTEQIAASFLGGFLLKLYTKTDRVERKLHNEIASVKERLIRLEESGKWVEQSLERIEEKLK